MNVTRFKTHKATQTSMKARAAGSSLVCWQRKPGSPVQHQDLFNESECWLADRVVGRQFGLCDWQLNEIPAETKQDCVPVAQDQNLSKTMKDKPEFLSKGAAEMLCEPVAVLQTCQQEATALK